MTNYVYIASDKRLDIAKVNGSLELLVTEDLYIQGFLEAIQLEIVNGTEKIWQLRELYSFIQQHMTVFQQCTVEVGHVLNSIHHNSHIAKQETIQFDEFDHFNQLSLKEGTLLRIRK